MKVLKYALAAAGALILAAGLFVAYFVLTFDVRDYEPRIVALVKEKTGRTLVVRGETRLALWPDLGLTLGPVTLSERDSDTVFAEVGNARLVAKLRPLLSKELVADELHLQGANVRITRDAEGRLNIDDLLGGEGGALEFDIARARVERSRLVYEDLATGARHEISDLSLESGRLASGVPTAVTASFTARDGAQAYAVTSKVSGRLTFDLKQRTYAFESAVLHIAGKVSGIDAVTAEVGIGSLAASQSGVGATAVSLDARAANWHARMKAPRVVWREGAIGAADAAFDVDVARDGRKLAATFVAGVSAAVAGRTVELTNVRAKLVATGAGLPRRGIEAALAGSAGFDGRAGRAYAVFSGTALDSRVKATLTAAGSASPAYTFALDIDSLDLDRLSASVNDSKSGGKRGEKGGEKGGEGFDLADLSNVGAAGTLRIGSLKSSGVVAKNVQLAMKP